jgi:hypothetical protein
MSKSDAKANAEESLSRLFEPDMILPSQFSDRVNLGPSAYPEKRLMLAVLEDAVATFQRYVDARDRRGQRLHREAEEWFQSRDNEWPFAFENICNALEIEAEYLRRGLARWKEKQLRRTDGGARVYRFPFRRVNGRRHSISIRSDGVRESA